MEREGLRRIRVGDLDIAYHDEGPVSGSDPVLFLHGAVQTHRVWRRQRQTLAAERRVLAPDFRGHGATSRGDHPITIERLAADGLAFLDALGLRRAVLCGVSLGGMVALEMAAMQPSRASALILANTPLALSLSKPVRQAIQRLGPQRVLRPAFALLGQRLVARIGLGAARKLLGRDWVGEDAARHFVEGFAAMQAEVVIETYAAVVGSDPARIGRLDVPCLVILGRHESDLVAGHANAIARRLGRTEIVVLDGGHVTNLDAPQAFTAALADFLARVDAARTPA